MSEGGIDAGETRRKCPQRCGHQCTARSDRRERRREGYPPEGARPCSGLDRVARSQSDAPGTIVPGSAVVSIFGTIVATTVDTMSDSVTVSMRLKPHHERHRHRQRQHHRRLSGVMRRKRSERGATRGRAERPRRWAGRGVAPSTASISAGFASHFMRSTQRMTWTRWAFQPASLAVGASAIRCWMSGRAPNLQVWYKASDVAKVHGPAATGTGQGLEIWPA